MTYIDAFFDRKKDIINVVERVNGERIYKEYIPDYSFYVENDNGKYITMTDKRVSKIQINNKKDFNKRLKQYAHKKLYESDVNLIYRCFEQHYQNTPPPKLHIAFIDIETAIS